MKQAFTYSCTLLLLLLFSTKVAMQASAMHLPVQKFPVGQQDEKSCEENCTEKSMSSKADFMPQTIHSSIVQNEMPYSPFPTIATHTSLPAQYYAIPTPPPWNS